MSTPSAHISNRKNYRSSEKWLGKEIHMLSLQHLVGLEISNSSKKHKRKNIHIGGSMSKGHRNRLKELTVTKLKQFQLQNKVVVAYKITQSIKWVHTKYII